MWEVLLLGKYKNDFELSVVRSDNQHGRSSWGWGGKDKIILFSDEQGVTKKDKAFMESVACGLRDYLNKRNL